MKRLEVTQVCRVFSLGVAEWHYTKTITLKGATPLSIMPLSIKG